MNKQKITRHIKELSYQQKKVNVDIIISIFKESKYYVAYCPALELSSYGKTEKEAKAYFEDALKVFLEDTIERGTLEKCLLKFGWTLQQKPEIKYLPPRIENELEKIVNSKIIREHISIPVY
jgi:predicted RNase H-like HicB family nuclease